jgi:hypothetical protein
MKKGPPPRVNNIFMIRVAEDIHDKYLEQVERVGKSTEVRRFHGTSLGESCNLGIDLSSKPCDSPDCAVCSICKTGFDMSKARDGAAARGWERFGPGLYFSSTSGKSNDYAQRSVRIRMGRKCQVMFLCKVALGREFKTSTDLPDLKKPPLGYDSVVGEVGTDVVGNPGGTDLNYDECVLYNDESAVPSYLISYSFPEDQPYP